MKRLIMVGLGVMLLQGWADAHAFLDHAEPRVGATVAESPTEVRVWFTEKVEPAFSGVEVQDADGKRVDKKDCHQDEKDKTLLIVTVPTLAAGKYKVVWHVVCVDTHKTKGDFRFTVKP
jgi:hypothetical protein